MGSEIKLKEHIRQLEENLLSPEIRTSRTELKKILADPIYFAEKYFYIISLDGRKTIN